MIVDTGSSLFNDVTASGEAGSKPLQSAPSQVQSKRVAAWLARMRESCTASNDTTVDPGFVVSQALKI